MEMPREPELIVRQNRTIALGRIVKFFISAVVFVGISLLQGLLRLLGIRWSPRCMVLYYHSVPAEYRERFARQLDVILRHTKPVHPEHTNSLEDGGRYCLITFDDGFTNFMEIALPELASRKIPSLLFIITEALGKSFGPAKAPEEIMTAEQLRGLPESLVVIGSHTVTHPYLPELPEQDARRELVESRLKLERLLNKPVPFFSFPFGGMTPGLVSLCKEVGYKRIFSTIPAFTCYGQSDYCIGRVRVDPWDWPPEFRLKLAGAYNWLPAAISLKRSLFGNRLVSALRGEDNSGGNGKIRRSFIHS
jgi:peptidoglycan/xylan/chitin deacetylase (PgdA/CDA1 family)